MSVPIDPIEPDERDAAQASGAAKRLRGLRLPWLFLIVVVAPSLAAAAYYAVASPVYVSEAHFIVRSADRPLASGAGLSSVLQGVGSGIGLGHADTDAFAVHDYVESRNAVAELERDLDLRAMLNRPGTDVVARFPRPFQSADSENLFRAYQRFVKVTYDSTTGISTLKVSAFRPADAQAIAHSLLLQGEALVNQLNVQAETDAVSEAKTEVIEAQSHLTQAQAALTAYRNKEGIIDPKSTSLGGLDLIAKLSTDLAALRAERAGLAASAPQSPQLPGMDNRITAYQQQIDMERTKLVGESSSLSSKISDFERLTFDAELAGKELASAMTALDGSRQEARRKRLYLQRVVEPRLPESPALPHRLASVLIFLVSTLMAYAIAKLVAGALKEHRQ